MIGFVDGPRGGSTCSGEYGEYFKLECGGEKGGKRGEELGGSQFGCVCDMLRIPCDGLGLPCGGFGLFGVD